MNHGVTVPSEVPAIGSPGPRPWTDGVASGYRAWTENGMGWTWGNPSCGRGLFGLGKPWGNPSFI